MLLFDAAPRVPAPHPSPRGRSGSRILPFPRTRTYETPFIQSKDRGESFDLWRAPNRTWYVVPKPPGPPLPFFFPFPLPCYAFTALASSLFNTFLPSGSLPPADFTHVALIHPPPPAPLTRRLPPSSPGSRCSQHPPPPSPPRGRGRGRSPRPVPPLP